MNANEILALYNREQRIEVQYPDLRKENMGDVIRFVGKPLPNHNFILYSQLNEENADAVIEREIAYFDSIGHPFEWKVYNHDSPPDLRQRLLDRGFNAREQDAIMTLDVRDAPDFLRQPDTAVNIRRLTHPDQLDDIIAVLSQVWPDESHDWVRDVLGDDLRLRPDFAHVFVAYVNDQPASAGWIYFHENSQFASLWGGSTVPKHRKKRLYTAVMAARVQAAIQRGYRFLTIDASPMNKPIAASRGFQLLTYAHACTWGY
ncbi:MAG: GNAT family N-acetyltransferase [Chloroflexi bacterium]|nr:GNAT family N-acetyltransferase [Chloroflexota bacterium]